MHYISADEAAAKWRVSSRQVQRLLATGRIPAAKKLGRAWMIPGHVTKPDSILDSLHEPRLRLQVEGEFAYLRLVSSKSKHS